MTRVARAKVTKETQIKRNPELDSDPLYLRRSSSLEIRFITSIEKLLTLAV